VLGRCLGVGVERAGGDDEEGAASAAGLEIAAAAPTPRAVERERRELVRGGMAAEPKRAEGGMAEVVGSGLLGDAWWECAGRRKASELPVGLLPLPRWVSFRPGLARVFKAPPPARWTADLKLRCDVFLETGPIAECDGDGGNLFRSKVGESRRPAWQRP